MRSACYLHTFLTWTLEKESNWVEHSASLSVMKCSAVTLASFLPHELVVAGLSMDAACSRQVQVPKGLTSNLFLSLPSRGFKLHKVKSHLRRQEKGCLVETRSVDWAFQYTLKQLEMLLCHVHI